MTAPVSKDSSARMRGRIWIFAALVFAALQRQTLGQALAGADNVVDAPLELALGNAAEVERDLGPLALFNRDGASAVAAAANRIALAAIRAEELVKRFIGFIISMLPTVKPVLR